MRIRNIAVVASAAIALAGCAQNDASSTADRGAPAGTPATAEDAPISASAATLSVQGLSCPLCASNVDKQLLKVRGVRDVQVDLGAGEVRVEFAGDARPSRGDLRKAVEDSGYTLVAIETH